MKLSDIEIAHNAKIEPIGIIAEKLLGHECDLAYENIGGEMAKLPIGLIDEEKIKSTYLLEQTVYIKDYISKELSPYLQKWG